MALHRLYLALGSNLGDRHRLIQQAVELIGKRIGTVLELAEPIETEPEGFSSKHRFLNTALSLETRLSPEEVLRETEGIECDLGRRTKSQGGKYQDRPIDIDLLLYDALVLDTERLTLPHPRMHERLYVLNPLVSLAGMASLPHPRLGECLGTLLERLELKTLAKPAEAKSLENARESRSEGTLPAQ